MASSTIQHKSREDAKRARELDEARKAGLAPHEVDAETGQTINPHIPHYMVNAPWYLSQDKPTLTHQKDWRLKDKIADKWYARGARGKQNVKFKKGACENCGATTHKTKECLERPRKMKAKFTNEDLARDDVIENIDFDSWAHKRDAYKGYQAEDYAEVIQHFDKVNEAREEVVRQEIAAEKYKEDGTGDAEAATGDAAAEAAGEGAAGGDDEDKLKDDQQAEFTKVDKRVRTAGGGATGSVRNLRIREDTAKYLLNLDPKSAHYDPKSRSMRADPTPDKPASEKTFAGDNALRTTGDEFEFWQRVTEHTVMEGERGSAAHVQATPTQAVMAHEAFKQKKAKLAAKNQQAVLEKYGNASAAAPDKDLLLPESEAYVEYDRAGRVVRGAEHVAKSRYDEDVHPGNHTSVWGSHWEAGQWGYACCKALHRNAMCLGGKAEAAREQAAAQMAANAERAQAQRDKAAAQEPVEGSSRARHPPGNSAAVWGTEGGDDDADLDEAKVQAALIRLQEAEGQDPVDADADGPRRYNGLAADGASVTPEEMEAYRRFRARAADPIADMQKAVGAATDGYGMV